MREYFLLDHNVTFLNHGSFGACPAAVFAVYQHWQRELEHQPVDFMIRRAPTLINDARKPLAAYINADPQDVVFVTNATSGVNTVARSLNLKADDEILLTDHIYGAVDYTWQYVCERSGAKTVMQPIPLPLPSPDEIIDLLWQAVTPRTKVIAISHITSPTAIIFPIAEICARARAEGILTVIDGAHAPGQIPLDMAAIGADFYTGNCHKWLCAPKGSAFLYVRREHHDLIEPLVISWGWRSQANRADATLNSRHDNQGTRDLAAYLSVPSALEFLAANEWDAVRERCHALAIDTRDRIAAFTGMPHLASDEAFGQMVAFELPSGDAYEVATRLLEDYRIEIPGIQWNTRQLLRVSFQGYNSADDATTLVDALQEIYTP